MADDVFPDRDMALRDKIAWIIETNGWAIEPVAAHGETDPPIPGYSYTIGFEDTFGFPDVVVFGLTPVASRGLVGLVAEFLQGGTDLPLDAVFVGLLDNGLRCALISLDAGQCGDLFTSATAWYGVSRRMVQLVWPDRHGVLPWEDGFEHRLALAQPVLGDVPG